jgi:nitrous oxide reductase accessory protein NosL
MKHILLLLSMLLLLACGEKTETNKAAEMHWDRDMCARCVMVISDRKNSVQVQEIATKKVDKFDDFGCMVIRAEENSKDISKNYIVWVTDVNSGEWIDAKKALYTAGNTTPMAYGYSAYKSKSEVPNNQETFSFDEVYKFINK